MKSHWFSIKAAAKPGGRAQVHIYDEIGGWGISANRFREEIEALGDVPIDVRISSPGGSAFDGIAMHTVLARLSDVDTYADSAVASAATLPFMAGKRRIMADGAALFIHNPWNIAAGDAEGLRKVADALDVATESLAAIYARATGKDREEIKKVMKAETWMDAQAAKSDGWATDIGEAITVQANIQPGRYPGTPKAFVRANPAHDPNRSTMNKLTIALAQAGLLASADVAEDAAIAQLTDTLKARGDALAKLTSERDAATKQATDATETVKALAKHAAEAAVKSGQITDGVRAKWQEQLVAAPAATLELLAGIQPKAHGHSALSIAGPGGEQPKTLTQRCIEAKAAEARK
jgi:ATP-dependent protease ClpP protease subunit